MAMDAERGPLPRGENVALTAHATSTARTVGQVLETIAKSEAFALVVARDMEVMCRLVVPSLVTETVSALLVLP